MRLPNDVCRCYDAEDCEMGNVCLRNDEGRIWSHYRKTGYCNKENNYKELKLAREGNGEMCDENDKKT